MKSDDTQKPPTANKHKPTVDSLIEKLDRRKKVDGALAKALEARKEFGTKRYGTPLQPFNGRDSLQDAYEEVVDLLCYLKNCYDEGSVPDATLWSALALAKELTARIQER